jgi:hypothetical protein
MGNWKSGPNSKKDLDFISVQIASSVCVYIHTHIHIFIYRCGNTGTFILEKLLWEKACQFLRKLNRVTIWPYMIPLGVYPKELKTYPHRKKWYMTALNCIGWSIQNDVKC